MFIHVNAGDSVFLDKKQVVTSFIYLLILSGYFLSTLHRCVTGNLELVTDR